MKLDLYHRKIDEADLSRCCDKCFPWIGEIQVADNPDQLISVCGNVEHLCRSRHCRHRQHGEETVSGSLSGSSRPRSTSVELAFRQNTNCGEAVYE